MNKKGLTKRTKIKEEIRNIGCDKRFIIILNKTTINIQNIKTKKQAMKYKRREIIYTRYEKEGMTVTGFVQNGSALDMQYKKHKTKKRRSKIQGKRYIRTLKTEKGVNGEMTRNQRENKGNTTHGQRNVTKHLLIARETTA